MKRLSRSAVLLHLSVRRSSPTRLPSFRSQPGLVTSFRDMADIFISAKDKDIFNARPVLINFLGQFAGSPRGAVLNSGMVGGSVP